MLVTSTTQLDPPVPRGRVKGLALLELVKGIRALRGDAGLVAMIDRFPAELRAQLHDGRDHLGVLAGTWYPAALLNAFYAELTANLPASERRQLADLIGKHYVERLLRGVYRIIFEMVMTPERYVKHAQRLWNQNNDSGRLEMALVDPCRLEGRMAEWRGHHPFGCEVAHQIGFHVFLAMGCQGLHSKLVCKSQSGAEDCTGSYTWRGRGSLQLPSSRS